MLNKARKLHKEEISVRSLRVNNYGVQICLYTNRSILCDILDETYGIDGWKKETIKENGITKCTLSIYSEDKKEWISKDDYAGMPDSGADDSIKLKSESTDAFKRACSLFGISRELETAPKDIFISANKITLEKDRKKTDRYICKDTFHVANIKYSDIGRIIELEIANQKGSIVWSMENPESVEEGDFPVAVKESRNSGNGKLETYARFYISSVPTQIKENQYQAEVRMENTENTEIMIFYANQIGKNKEKFDEFYKGIENGKINSFVCYYQKVNALIFKGWFAE